MRGLMLTTQWCWLVQAKYFPFSTLTRLLISMYGTSFHDINFSMFTYPKLFITPSMLGQLDVQLSCSENMLQHGDLTKRPENYVENCSNFEAALYYQISLL